MAIEVIWAEPGPEADKALRRHWQLAYQFADERIKQEKIRELLAASSNAKEEPKAKRQ